MDGREAHIGENVRLRFVEEAGEPGQFGAELIGDPAPLRAGGLGVILREGRGDEGGDAAPSDIAGAGEDVAHEVDAAALPGGVQHLGDGGLDAFRGIGNHQLDATQAAAGELAQERGPERFGLGGADIKPENLEAPVAVDSDRDDYGDRDDAAGWRTLT